jgi:thioredoxin 1
MTKGKAVHLTDADFEKTISEADGISVVDFWAPWCGPCHTMAPALESFAAANEDKLNVYKLDVDDNPKTAEKYKIKSIPTVIFFRNGEVAEINVGAMTESSLQSKLEELL